MKHIYFSLLSLPTEIYSVEDALTFIGTTHFSIPYKDWFILNQLGKMEGFKGEVVSKLSDAKGYQTYLEMEKEGIFSSSLESYQKEFQFKSSSHSLSFQNKKNGDFVSLYFFRISPTQCFGVLSKVQKSDFSSKENASFDSRNSPFIFYEENGSFYIPSAFCQLGGEELERFAFDSAKDAADYIRILTYRGKEINSYACPSCYQEYKEEFLI